MWLTISCDGVGSGQLVVVMMRLAISRVATTEHKSDDGVHARQHVRGFFFFLFLTCKKKAAKGEENNTIHQ